MLFCSLSPRSAICLTLSPEIIASIFLSPILLFICTAIVRRNLLTYYFFVCLSTFPETAFKMNKIWTFSTLQRPTREEKERKRRFLRGEQPPTRPKTFREQLEEERQRQLQQLQQLQQPSIDYYRFGGGVALGDALRQRARSANGRAVGQPISPNGRAAAAVGQLQLPPSQHLLEDFNNEEQQRGRRERSAPTMTNGARLRQQHRQQQQQQQQQKQQQQYNGRLRWPEKEQQQQQHSEQFFTNSSGYSSGGNNANDYKQVEAFATIERNPALRRQQQRERQLRLKKMEREKEQQR